MRRHEWWMLVAIVVLVVGTVVALTRQQANFDEHQHITERACQLALRNRILLLKLTDIELTEPDHVEQAASLQKLRHEVATLIASQDCSM